MVRRNFKIGGIDTSNVNISANGFATTLTANAALASNVSFSLPGADGNSGQVLATDGGGNLFFADSSANTQAYVGDSLLSNTALILEAGDGVSVSGNTVSGVVSFSTSMSNVTSQVISVDGSANSFSLTKSVSNSHMVLVAYNGLLQDPTTYSVSGTTLTISNSKPLLADSTVEVRYFDFFSLPGTTESSGGGGGAYSFQGENFGYTSGGFISGYQVATIDKFPFSSDSNATDVGDLINARMTTAGQSSTTHGYTSGGRTSGEIATIDKFPFSSDADATSVGNLTNGRQQTTGQSSSSSGYVSGGEADGSTTNTTEKFSFSSDANATSAGNLTQARRQSAGQSSTTYGYTSGGFIPAPVYWTDTIDKFPFTSDTNATDVGELNTVTSYGVGQSSTTHGYTSGGYSTPVTTAIKKFSFSSDGNATITGNLTQGRTQSAGQSSTTHGYTSGGHSTTVDKFPFSSDSNATDVGDLTQSRSIIAGQQY